MESKKKQICLPILICVGYLVFLYFVLLATYSSGWLIPLADVNASNIFQKLLVDIADSFLIVAIILAYVQVTEKSLAGLRFSKKHLPIVGLLLAVYIIFFFLHGKYSLNGIYTALFYLVTVAFCEEFVFRGFLFTAIERAYGFWSGAIVSGILWGIPHAFIPAIARDQNLWIGVLSSLGGGILAGAVFAFILKKSNNILIPILCHALLDYLPFGLNVSGST